MLLSLDWWTSSELCHLRSTKSLLPVHLRQSSWPQRLHSTAPEGHSRSLVRASSARWTRRKKHSYTCRSGWASWAPNKKYHTRLRIRIGRSGDQTLGPQSTRWRLGFSSLVLTQRPVHLLASLTIAVARLVVPLAESLLWQIFVDSLVADQPPTVPHSFHQDHDRSTIDIPPQ